VAGLTIGVMIIPQAMAYAYLAGLPAIYGLYNAFIPPLVYFPFGKSPNLAIGPLAVMGLLISETISSLNPADTAEYVSYSISLAFLIGVIYLTLGILRLGFLFNFLSRPVLSGKLL
jgi:SulP family sulfate permease